MLQEARTLEIFGYETGSLTRGSHKSVCIQCDYCKSEYEIPYKAYFKGREVIEKDACIKCKFDKRRDVSLKLYGVANSAQRPEVRKKISEKCEGFDQKRIDAMEKKYGVTNAMQSQELKDRQKESVQEKYGVDNVSQVPEIRAKAEQTNLEKFGNKQFLASEYGKEQKLEGVRKKYGVDNVFQSEEIKEKIRATNMENLGVDHHFKIKEKALENAKKVVESKIENGTIKLYDGKTISDWARESGYSKSAFGVLVNKHGLDIAKTMTPKRSSLEQMVEGWLKNSGINYASQFRVLNRVADFLLTDYNIIIETDGLYWHSEVECDDNYHVDKHQLYMDSGYRPFFFREDELNNKFDIVKSIINNAIGKHSRIFARKCSIVELSREEAVEFFEKNHLMGRGRGISYGLKYGEDIVSAIIIRKISNNDYDISRFCSVLNTQVIGGFSRLVKHFLRNNQIDSLTTFIDKRYGSGSYLTNLGFVFESCYPSFRWTNGNEIHHRLKYSGNSGYDNGCVKIWDCGQAKYVFRK